MIAAVTDDRGPPHHRIRTGGLSKYLRKPLAVIPTFCRGHLRQKRLHVRIGGHSFDRGRHAASLSFSERGRQRSRWLLDDGRMDRARFANAQLIRLPISPSTVLVYAAPGRHTLPTVVEFSSEDAHPTAEELNLEIADDALAWVAARPCQHRIAQRRPDWRTTSAQLDSISLCSWVRAIGMTRLEPGVPPPRRHSTPGLSMGGTGFVVATVRRRSTVGPG